MHYTSTKEKDFESLIEKALSGVESNWLAEPVGGYNDVHNGFAVGVRQNFNAKYAIDKQYFWQFLHSAFEQELANIKRLNPNDWQEKILSQFDRHLQKYGLLHVLKSGFDVGSEKLKFFFSPPVPGCAEKVRLNFDKNIWSVMRQVPFSQKTTETVDMVLFLNGLPIITLELKNQWTHQTATLHGRSQYRSRDLSQTLFQPARCLVHFAVDLDDVWMTTKLAGEKTVFLPFNQGNHFGKGNPPNASGVRTAYLWQDIFSKASLANIIQHFVRLDGSSKEPLAKRTLFFPRYHQLDVVRRLVQDCSENGVGKRYLIQHSAGSGKSNSITWLAFQLIETYPILQNSAKKRPLDKPLFDSVIVVTDRRLLDKQIRDNIKEFSAVKNIIAPAFNSQELKLSLEQGKKIIITTIQKFPFIVDGIADLSEKNFAVIIDEAHSSQSGTAHDNMNRAMGVSDDASECDAQDALLKMMQSRKMRGNASYFAFTATPKNSTLEKFGILQADGSFKPFHLYSMKQAIEEGFILDVLANYTTYKSFYEIQKSVQDNPEFDSKKAQKRLKAFVERSQQTIEVKAEVMLNHFIDNVFARKKLQGKGKAMAVTQDIETAIRYYHSLKALLAERGNPFKIAIAFSGAKKIGDKEVTEAVLNGFADSETTARFDDDEYRMLVVANKYLTGFDQPKLCTMYVDKKLTDVLCVQTLSRLNRSAPKLGKRTEDLFVLDFFNDVDDIKKAFDPFYTSTTLSEATDISVLSDLKIALDETGVYEQDEAAQFVELYFQQAEFGRLSALIDTAVNRFDNELGWELNEKIDFKVKAKQFVKIYGQMAAIMPFEKAEWEQLFWFLKFLIPKLQVQDPQDDAIDGLLNSVDLSSYGLARTKIGVAIKLDAEEAELKPQNPHPRGTSAEDEERDLLDDIIKTFNQFAFAGWEDQPEEQRVKFLNLTSRVRKHRDFATKFEQNSDPATKGLVLERIMRDVVDDMRRDELEFYKRYVQDEAFRVAMIRSMERWLSM